MLHGCIYTLQEENYSLALSSGFFFLPVYPFAFIQAKCKTNAYFSAFSDLGNNGALNVIKLGITL